MAPKKSPLSADRIIGANVRRIRLSHNLTQERLADELGLTFQQVQKYEKGTNRIGGSRLAQIADALSVSISALFESVPMRANNGSAPSPHDVLRLGDTREGLKLAKAFHRLSDLPTVRRRLVDAFEAVADHRG